MARFSWDAFAGGIAKGIQTEQDMRAKQQQLDWDKEDHDYIRQQRADETALKADLKAAPKEGDVIGGRKFAPQSFATADEADAALQQARSQMPAAVANQASDVTGPQIDTGAIAAALPTPAVTKAGKVSMTAPTAPAKNPVTAQPAPDVNSPTVGQQYNAGANDWGINLDKAVKFYDPHSQQWHITDQDNARRATFMDTLTHSAAAYMAHGQADKAMDLQLKGQQYIAANAANNQARANRIISSAMVKPGGPSADDINTALNALSADDGITLGGRFEMVKTQDGKYTLGAAPDGTNLPAQPITSFGSYSTPQQAFTALAALVSGDTKQFADIQNTIFNQQTTMQQLAIQKGHLDETIRSNKANEGIRSFEAHDASRRGWAGIGIQNKELGLRKAEADARIAALDQAAPAGIAANTWKRIQTDVRTVMQSNPDLTLDDAYNQALGRQPISVRDSYNKAMGITRYNIPTSKK